MRLYKSQRTDDFKGGIQNGQIAGDELAINQDGQCKKLRDRLTNIYRNLEMKKKLHKKDIPFGEGACSPDGGLWFKDGTLSVVFEVKKQGESGNAIERWFKNFYICQKINSDVTYITFAIGSGAPSIIKKTLYIAHEGIFNQYRKGKACCFISEKRFMEEEMFDIMSKALKDCNNETSV